MNIEEMCTVKFVFSKAQMTQETLKLLQLEESEGGSN